MTRPAVSPPTPLFFPFIFLLTDQSSSTCSIFYIHRTTNLEPFLHAHLCPVCVSVQVRSHRMSCLPESRTHSDTLGYAHHPLTGQFHCPTDTVNSHKKTHTPSCSLSGGVDDAFVGYTSPICIPSSLSLSLSLFFSQSETLTHT